MIASANSAWPTGPYSAVRPGELSKGQDPVESSGPDEPVDEMVPITQGTSVATQQRAPSTQSMVEQGQRSAGAALAAFPQIVHLLANPELHLADQIAKETGLPVVSLVSVKLSELEGLLHQPQFAEGFILEGFPQNRAGAEELDGLLSATAPDGHRVLGFEATSEAQQEVVDHYIDQGLLWQVPTPSAYQSPEQVRNTLLECLVGLPALE